MFGITNLTTYVLGVVAIILLPGPNSLFCLTTAAQHGKRAAFKAMAAVFVGDSLLMLLTIFGAASVLHTFPAVFVALKWLGGAYLAYLGVKLLMGAWRSWQLRGAGFRQPEFRQTPKNVFCHALLLSLLNPKAILFYLSFFIQFVNPNYPNPALTFLIMALILQTISMIYFTILSWSGIKLVAWFGKRQGLSALAMGATGALFIGFAVKLATS